MNGRGGSRLLDRAIQKHKSENFEWEILHDGVLPEFLDDFEVEAISKHNTLHPNGYNLKTGGANGSPSAETRQRLSEANKGKTLSPERCKEMSELHKGKTLSPETRRKIGKARKGHEGYWKGKPFSSEHCRNISEALKGKSTKIPSAETRRKMSKAKKGVDNPRYWQGKKRSAETRKKMSESAKKRPSNRKGQKLSEEQRKRLSESWANRKFVILMLAVKLIFERK